MQKIFETLANDFSDYVVAISEVPVKPDEPKDLMTLINEWHEDKHPAVSHELKTRGVIIFEEHADRALRIHH